MSYDKIRLLSSIIILILVVVYAFNKAFIKGNKITTKTITRVGIFGALSAILYIVPYFKFSVPFFPSFLEIHFDEIPALIGGFAYGPLTGFLIILLKTIIKLPFSSTLCVGELADFVYGSILVVTSAWIYKKHRNIKGAIISLLVAMVVQVIASAFITTFLMLDFYIFMMGFPKMAILGMCQAINPNIKTLTWDFLLMVAVPFNAFKDVIIIVLTFLLYKQTRRLIDRIARAQKN